jgi:acyl transferase domain-containing protein/acyl carrier protein
LPDLQPNSPAIGQKYGEKCAAAVDLQPTTSKSDRLLAIIGLAFRFPGDLSNEDELWSALQQGRDLVTQVPEDRWARTELQHQKRAEPGRSITFSAGVLSRIDEFDAGFFGISPREAAWLDPQQRLLLELAWEAMENAGTPPSRLAGTDCAVYLGISSLDYGTRALDDLASLSAHSMTGNTLSVAANRLSYVFDLHGPSLAVDTACSSSLVALHHACRALQTGEADTALVGGVSLLLHPCPFIGFTKASMLSAEGRCKTFDASGSGYVRAEGGAVLLLKPLDRALADGDEIQAVILASGANADGARKTGITIPSREGQAELMRSVLAQSGLKAQDIDFIEAHGTGTVVGDPIETSAIGEIYGQGRTAPLPLGSIKANMGHMEAASGMAGLVKTLLALKHRALPPQIHLETPNPQIDFVGLNLQPVTQYQRLDKDSPLIAGLNSFGFGGANAHILLQEYRHADHTRPANPAQPASSETLLPLILSARSDAALRALAQEYAQRLGAVPSQDAHQQAYDLAYAAAHRRDRLEKRLVLNLSAPDAAAQQLAAFAQGGLPEAVLLEDALPQAGGIAFVYTGNGAQWLGMGLRLLEESAHFAELFGELDAKIAPLAGFSLLAELQADAEHARLDDTMVAQPLLFAIQVALTQLIQAQGVRPAAVAGHSLGEVAAAWAAGALDLDSAIRVILVRSHEQGATRGSGRMAAVGLSASAMQTLLDDMANSFGARLDLSIAGINSPNNLTLSGDLADLQRIQAHLEASGTFFRLLDIDYGFHSSRMEPIKAPLLAGLTGLAPRQTQAVAFVSTVTGAVLPGERLDADYWWHNVREPVLFAEATETLARLGCRIFIEIGPHAILQRYIGESLGRLEIKGRALPLLRKEADGLARVIEGILRAQLLAESPQLAPYFLQPGRPVRLPNYPWQRERHWHPRTSESLRVFDRRRIHPLLGWPIPEAEQAWENLLDPSILPWLADHQVGGAIVFPGAGYVEMALAAAREWLGGERLAFEELDILAPMVFDGEHARSLRLELRPRDGSFQIKSRQRLSEDEWTLHAAGRIFQPTTSAPKVRIPPLGAADIRIKADDHYHLASSLGLDYGPAFQGLHEAMLAGDALEARLALPNGLTESDYLIHPALLDLCYQSLVDFFQDEIAAGQGVALLPIKTGRLERYAPGRMASFRARLRRRSARSVLADFELFDAEGTLLASLGGCRFRAAPLAHRLQDRVTGWRIDPWLQPHPTEGRMTELPSTQALIDQTRIAMADQKPQRSAWFKEALPLFEALVLSFALAAFRRIAQQQPERLQTLAVSSDPYSLWLAGLLRQEGLLLERQGQWSLLDDDNLPAAAEIWRTLLREHPATLPQLVLLGRLGRNLPTLLLDQAGRPAFLNALWRSPSADGLYGEDPAYLGTRQAMEHILHQLAKDLPSHRRLRVLEIAAGPSDLPRRLLAMLPQDRLDYQLALPEGSVERQQVDYGQHPNLGILTLDSLNWWFGGQAHGQTDRQPASDWATFEGFDVVIVRQSLHRAANPKAALNQIWRWLAAGGLLLLAERHPDWSADFLAGLDANWWHEADAGHAPQSSLLPPAAWTAALAAEGFDEVRAFSEPAAEGLSEGAYLILARRPLQSLATQALADPATWLLLADADSRTLAEGIAARLESQNQQVQIAGRLTGQAPAGIDHLVQLRGWNATAETLAALLAEALADTQALAATAGTGQRPRLWIITQGGALAEGLPVTCAPNPAQAALWGFGRVVMNEHPELCCTLIDLACASLSPSSLNRLENEFLHPDGNNEILLGDTGRHTLVLREQEEQQLTAAQGHFRLDFHLPGKLRNLRWLPQSERQLQEGEVEVQVQATGLNFRDLMYLMGLLPDEAVEKGFAGASLGLEFSGILSRVGPRVHDLRPGDRVMGFGSACFASHVTTRADALALMPDDWSFESAATVPTVFFTVYYALKHLADLQPRERILIHGGAGGVGIAAIQLAKHLGAEVFATAGSNEKRDFVRLLGADHVFDSRSLDFADHILAATADEGVDLVLNSLAGEAIRRNLAILKPFGRFLELGKRDFFENTPIGLRPFKDNISYFGIDADQLLTGRPQLAARLFREVMALFHEGVLTPLPCRVFPAEQVVEAFRTMQQARHIGKVVVSLAGASPAIERSRAESAPQVPFQLSRDSTWLVTGGLSGFGLESARWLAAKGVGHLLLLGRRGLETPGAAAAVAALTNQGVQVEVAACDISDGQALAQLMERMGQILPPLKGVIHAAAVFDDALLQNLDPQRMQTVLSPKLLGAWNLHQATLDIPLEHFLLYSSITTAIGNPGQANYVAANAGLEGLAAMRRAMGLPAVCIGWGPVGDAGYLTHNETVRDSLEQRLGKAPLRAQQALDQLASILPLGGSLGLANFDWNSLARLLPSATSGRFTFLNRSLKSAGLSENEADFQTLIAGKSPEEIAAIIQQWVLIEVAQILAISADRIDPARSLHDLGLDSLMAVELAMGLEQRLGIQLPVMMLNESPTVDKVTRGILDKLLGNAEADAPLNALDATVNHLARQHGEAVSAEEMQEVADDARALAQRGGRMAG